ncbi:MAG: hypothetical protein ACOX8D_07620 [Methanoculleus sp.]
MFPVCMAGDHRRSSRLDTPAIAIADESRQLFYGDPGRACSR